MENKILLAASLLKGRLFETRRLGKTPTLECGNVPVWQALALLLKILEWVRSSPG